MKAELKAKWIAALRSGEYTQGDTSLIWKGRHCCIGVLADISGAELITLRENLSGEVVGYGSRAWKTIGGLDEEDAEELAAMNDNGKSFGEIADYIEKNL